MVTLYCATTNPGKLAEFQQAAPSRLEIRPAGPFDCPETGSTFEENAVQKALCYAERIGALVFADDSGLEVDALGGDPGIRSARYAGPEANDAQNRALLLENLQRLGIRYARAQFVCILALAVPGRLLATCRGICEGVILDAQRGTGGFGYDPLFYFPPLDRTFAEISTGEKAEHSHRGKALRALVDWIDANLSKSVDDR